MTRSPVVFVLLCTLWMPAGTGFGAPQAGNTLEATFARMDQAAATFKGLTADIRQQSHTEVVDKDDVQEGAIAVKRVKPKDTRILINFTKPEVKLYAIGGGKFWS